VKALELHNVSATASSEDHNFRTGVKYYEGSEDLKKNSTIGLIYLNRAALIQNDSGALQYLGDLFYYGDDTVHKDQVKALELHNTSAAQNYGFINSRVGEEYYEGSEDLKKNSTIGLIYLNRAALIQNDSGALQYLGDLFYYGDDTVHKDQVKALELHNTLAAQNYGFTNFKTGVKYYEGSEDLKKNSAIGLIYLNRAALIQNDSDALQYLGDLFYYGDDTVHKDQVKALELHKVSATTSSGYHNFITGVKYYEGSENLKHNITICLIYLKRAALDQNSLDALQYISNLFCYNHGDIHEDLVKSLELHKALSLQSKMDDNFRIGREYYEGSKNLEKNSAIGLVYLETAALIQESSNALQYFGDLFYYGDGDTNKNQVKGLEIHQMSANCRDRDDSLSIGKEYYKGSENLKKNPTIGYIYLSAALDRKDSGLDDYLADIYYFGEGYEKYPKTALDLIMALENHI
jgi:hypothetical protein